MEQESSFEILYADDIQNYVTGLRSTGGQVSCSPFVYVDQEGLLCLDDEFLLYD